MVPTDNGVEFSATIRNLEGNHFRNAIKAELSIAILQQVIAMRTPM
jgi:hypothetical protein